MTHNQGQEKTGTIIQEPIVETLKNLSTQELDVANVRRKLKHSKMSENFEQLKAEYEAFRESSTQLEYELESEVTRVNELWRVSEEKLRQSEKQRISMKNILTEEVREL